MSSNPSTATWSRILACNSSTDCQTAGSVSRSITPFMSAISASESGFGTVVATASDPSGHGDRPATEDDRRKRRLPGRTGIVKPSQGLMQAVVDDRGMVVCRDAEIGDDFSEPLLDRVILDELGERYLGAGLKRLANASYEPVLVDMHLLEQGVCRHIRYALQWHFIDLRLERRAEQRTVHRKIEVRRRLVEIDQNAGWRPAAEVQSAVLDFANELHDPAVVEPCLVIEISTQLLGQPRHGALCDFAGLQPIIMHAQHS